MFRFASESFTIGSGDVPGAAAYLVEVLRILEGSKEVRADPTPPSVLIY
jgi:hypothetical protein